MKTKHRFLKLVRQFSIVFFPIAVAGISGMTHARTMDHSAPVTQYSTAQQFGPVPYLGPPANFVENWDSYTAGVNVHGQGGWKGWTNDPNAGALVSNAFSVSPANSININSPSDLVHEFGYSSGIWTVTAQQYIPAGFTGRSYFIFQNVYNDAQVGLSWSVQVAADSSTGNIENEAGAANAGAIPYVTGQWVPITLIIDLDSDTQEFFYNGSLLYSGSWSNQFPAQTTPGIAAIGAIDLFGNNSSPVYYDDVAITAGLPPTDDIFVDGFDPPPI